MSRTFYKLYIPRLMALLLCVLLLIPCVPVARAEGEGGYCGQNLTWSLTGGTLTISGSGPMYDYDTPDSAPWSYVREEIVRLVLPSGMTSVGSHAFYGCRNLLTVTIPGTVTTIGTFSFMECSGMEYLSIGGSVSTIGEYAFNGCGRLQSLVLPGSLRSIGNRAFYRCESIPSVTVPASVTYLGDAAFGRCENLVSADIQARIQVIPEFLFYGCSRLASVSLPPTATSVSPYSFGDCGQLSAVYYENLQSTSPTVTVPNGQSGTTTPPAIQGEVPGYVNSTTSGTNSDGQTTQSSNSVTQNDNVTLSSKVESSGNDANVDLSVTVRGEEDWEGVQMYVESTMNQSNCNPNATGSKDSANLNIYLSDGVTVDSNFIDAMNNLGVKVTVTSQNGSVWKPAQSRTETEAESYDLSYGIVAGPTELTWEMNAVYSFMLRFAASTQNAVTVQISLGKNWAYQSATLFRRDGEKLTRLQSVMADGSGCATFTLNSVSKDAEYAIGMNLPVAGPEEAPAIPQQMLAGDQKIESITPPVQYEITGRSSSWGMNLGQVMGILAAVMVGVIALVGFVMYSLNKRRLKQGYVPEWDDDEE